MQENQTSNPAIQSASEPVPTVVTVSTNDQPKSNGFLIILLSILLITSLAIAGFFAFQTQRLNEELIMKNEELKQTTQNIIEPTIEPVATSSSMTVDPTANWKTYTDPKQRFSINYPSSWRTISGDFFGTGPKEIGEDILWAVNTFDINTNSVLKVVDDLGKQFSDRKQTTIKIKVGGLNATQIITTTATINDWYLETVIFEDADTIFTVSNGAIKDSNLQKMVGVPDGTTFKDFYMSFNLIN